MAAGMMNSSIWFGAFVTTVFASVAGAQDQVAPPLPIADVLAVLDAKELDQPGFLALVRAGARSVPGLQRTIGDGNDERPPAVRRRLRALRAARLIGPDIADAMMPTLLAALSLDMKRDDVELLNTLAQLAPGVSDRGTLLDEVRQIELPAPHPQLDMPAFRRWVAKMRLWYDFQLRLTLTNNEYGAPVAEFVRQLTHEDPLRRRFAAQQLGRRGPAASAAVDALASCANTERHPRVTRLAGTGSLTADFHDLVRDAAAVAIARIDPGHVEARRGLTLLLQADAPQERFAALMAMTAQPNSDAFDVVPAVLAATGDDDLRIVGEAITTLMRLDARGASLLERLRELATAPTRSVAVRAIAALRVLDR